jgi:SAM-dependent methyltransferase
MTSGIEIPKEIIDLCEQTIGVGAQAINLKSPKETAADFLDFRKSENHLKILEKYVGLKNKKLLEIGSGYGINLAYFIKCRNVDGFGLEPEDKGFNGGIYASKTIFKLNDIDPNRIIAGFGESIPFPDNHFDIVYSANVLEHTNIPEMVLKEAFRVLKPGGILHFEVPNHLSYFEGHYLVICPPLIFKSLLPFWVKYIYGRDPAFAKTLQTQINPIWIRKKIKEIEDKENKFKTISLGEEIFLERIRNKVEFEGKNTEDALGKILKIVQILNVYNWLGRLFVILQGHYPLYITVQKVIK